MNLNKQEVINFGDKQLGGDNPVFIIAEIGTSHDGDLKKAEELIIASAEAGVDCVKFQYVIADEIIHPNTGKVLLPGGEISLYKRFLAFEKPLSFYSELKEITETNNLIFLCTPFGIQSAKNLKQIGVDGFKIASPELNHYPLLEETGNLPVILSTGVSTLGDIESSLSYLSKDSALLHCITSYPAPETEYNLKLVPALAAIFGVPVGISDHSKDPLLVPMLTTALGGTIIEKHITLRKNGNGLDDPIAVNLKELALMCRKVRKAEKNKYSETVKELYELFGRKRVDETIGTGIKMMALSELENYKTTNRSIMAVADIEKGEIFTEKNIALLRSEKKLKPGLPPVFYPKVLKRKAAGRINSGSGITWDCF